MAVSLATLRVLETGEPGIDVARDAAFVAEHSLGEYSALAAAGAFSIQRYGEAAAHARPGDAKATAGRGRCDGRTPWA
jgi:malonyl CoA-acyl carrier protein transacylase